MNILSKKNVSNYFAILPELLLELMESPAIKDLHELRLHTAELVLKTVPNKEVLHGLATTLAYLHLNPDATEAQLRETYILGWCLQMYATCYLISDDLFDQSETRHYESCWYLRNGKGNGALVDALLLESCVFYLLRKYFSGKPFYLELICLFNKSQMKMVYATHFERLLTNSYQSNLVETFTLENYTKCVNYKMSYYPTYIHVLIAMLLTGVPDPESDLEMKSIFSKIDFHFQVRDDFMDVFGDNIENEGETGNDIELGRCSWNICTTLVRADPNQKRELITNFGSGKTKEQTSKVVDLYKQIGLQEIHGDYENAEYQTVMEMVNNVSGPARPRNLFIDMMWASFPKARYFKTDPSEKEGITQESKIKAEMYFNFLKTYPDFLSIIIKKFGYEESNSLRWLVRLLDYNMLTGKKYRGLIVANCFRSLSNNPSKEEVWKSNIIGWCVELLQAAALIADDVMDSGELRRGRPCWYKLDQIENGALTDALLLETLVHQILYSVVGDQDYFLRVATLFQDITYKTVSGQQLDVITARGGHMKNYTLEHYQNLVEYKTSSYTFVLPVTLSLIMVGLDTDTLTRAVEKILLKIGYYFQAHDDFLDVFGDVGETGKIGTDISEGKCTWLLVTALQKGDNKTNYTLKRNYGKAKKSSRKKVVRLYKSVGLEEEFNKFKETTYTTIQEDIIQNNIFKSEIKDILLSILNSTFGKK